MLSEERSDVVTPGDDAWPRSRVQAESPNEYNQYFDTPGRRMVCLIYAKKPLGVVWLFT